MELLCKIRIWIGPQSCCHSLNQFSGFYIIRDPQDALLAKPSKEIRDIQRIVRLLNLYITIILEISQKDSKKLRNAIAGYH